MRSVRTWLMRSGTSKGPYFDRRDILKAVSNRGSIDILSKDEINVVTNVVGSGHPNQINGVGGGSSVTTKACIVMPNDDGTCRYWFLQCGTSTLTVDVSHGDCGNMIAGVGCFAIEMGMIGKVQPPSAKVIVHSMQSKNIFEIIVPIDSDNQVEYTGSTEVAGVPGTGSSIIVNSLNPSGSQFKKGLWITSNIVDIILGIRVTCIDCVRALIIVQASDFNMSGKESKSDLDANAGLMQQLESLRLAAGEKMGLGDCSNKASPKLCIVSESHQADIHALYFVAPYERDTHPTIAMTAAQALAVACLEATSVPGSITRKKCESSNNYVTISHAKGVVKILVQVSSTSGSTTIHDANVIVTGYERTVRPILSGLSYPQLSPINI